MKKNNKQIIIIVSEFYPELSELLLNDCMDHLIDNGIKKDCISVYRVSGVFEIPGAVSLCIQISFSRCCNNVRSCY